MFSRYLGLAVKLSQTKGKAHGLGPAISINGVDDCGIIQSPDWLRDRFWESSSRAELSRTLVTGTTGKESRVLSPANGGHESAKEEPSGRFRRAAVGSGWFSGISGASSCKEEGLGASVHLGWLSPYE